MSYHAAEFVGYDGKPKSESVRMPDSRTSKGSSSLQWCVMAPNMCDVDSAIPSSQNRWIEELRRLVTIHTTVGGQLCLLVAQKGFLSILLHPAAEN